jgi:hypothetical protein
MMVTTSLTTPSGVIPGFIPGTQGATRRGVSELAAVPEKYHIAAIRGRMGPGDEPRDDTELVEKGSRPPFANRHSPIALFARRATS